MTEAASTPASVDLTERYKATPDERAAVVAHLARKRQKRSAPRIKLTKKNGSVAVAADHPESPLGLTLLMEAIGTTSSDFFDGLMGQLINAGTHGREPDERTLNFMLAMIRGIEPKDEAECMLAAQMAAVHMTTMTFARRLNHVDNLAQQDSAAQAFNKLARTFALQMEALKRYRTGGEQRVTVQHVTVNEGGRAIVGAVSQAAAGTGGPGKREAAT